MEFNAFTSAFRVGVAGAAHSVLGENSPDNLLIIKHKGVDIGTEGSKVSGNLNEISSNL